MTLTQKIVTIFSVISKIKDCLKCWEGRGLTIAGRIQIFKTLAIPRTWADLKMLIFHLNV